MGRPIRLLTILFLVVALLIGTKWAGAITPSMTVTFFANPQGALPLVYQTASSPTPLQSFASMGYTNSDHFFLDWNTSPDGTGVTYADGQSYSFTADLNLYAQWEQNFHAVTFHENAGSSDSVYSSQVENSPTALTLEKNLNPSFSNVGFEFQNWNTSPIGNGLSFSDGAIFNFASPLDLYAQWAPVVGFSPNGGTGSQSSIVDTASGAVTLPLSVGVSRPGYSFIGWNAKVDGTGTTYEPGATFSTTVPATLYAQWAPVVGFSPNGGIGSQASIVGSASGTLTLPISVGLSRYGYSFSGWNTNVDGSGTTYQPGATFSTTVPTTLYAQWTPQRFSVTFNPNGGQGVVPTETANFGSSIMVPGASSLSHFGFRFLGWNSSPGASTPSYTVASPVLINGDLTLYAVWVPIRATLRLASNDGGPAPPAAVSFVGKSVVLPDGGGMSYPHHVLAGWSTRRHGSVERKPGQRVVLTGNVTWYAQWKLVTDVVRVDEGNGRLIRRVVAWGTRFRLPTSAPLPARKRLLGWRVVGGGTHLLRSAETVSISASVEFVAVYAPTVVRPAKIVLTLDPGSGVGPLVHLTLNSGTEWVVPPGTHLTRPGFHFLGWSTLPLSMRVDQPVGLREKVLRSQTLHAVWLALPSVSTLTEIAVVKEFAPNSSLLTPEILSSLDAGAQTIAKMGASRVEIFGFATLSDPVAGAASVAQQRAEAAATQLRRDLVGMGDSRVVVTWSGDGRLTSSVLRAFRVVELFAN